MNQTRVPALLLLILLSIAPSAWAAPLTIEFAPTYVAARNVTGNHDVIFFGISLEPRAFDRLLVRHLGVRPSVDGVAQYEVPVAQRAVWVAIDRQTGAYALGAPPGFPLRSIAVPRDLLLTGEVDALRLPFGAAEVLVMRPNGGIWVDQAAAGGAHDQSRGRGPLTLPLTAALSTERGRPPLTKLTPADLVIAIEPGSLAVFVSRGGRP